MKVRNALILLLTLFSYCSCAKANETNQLMTQARESFKKRNYIEAFTLYKKVLEIESNNIEAHQSLADIYFDSEKYEDAAIEYEKVVKLDKTKIDAMFNLGSCYGQLGKYEQAISWYKKSIPLHQPKEAQISLRGDLAEVYLRSGKIDKASEEIKEVLKSKAVEPDNFMTAGKIARAEGKKEEALKHFQTCMELYKSQKASKDILDKIQEEIDSTK